MTKLNDEGKESILQEAHRLTHGERNETYAHPFDDYSCTAALFTAVLGDKLRSPITAHEMALGMCCVKLSRESRVSKRDNLVDLAGYAWVARMCVEESERRTTLPGEEHTAIADGAFPLYPDTTDTTECDDEGCPHYGTNHVHVYGDHFHREDDPLPTERITSRVGLPPDVFATMRATSERLHLQGGF